MGKASRRKKNSIFSQPINVINEDTGEVIETFVNPKVAKYFNDMIKNGASKEEITELVSNWVTKSIEEKRQNAPTDGQHRKEA